MLHAADGLFDALGRQVSHHKDLRVGAGCLKGARGVIFRIGAGENRDKDPRTGRCSQMNRWGFSGAFAVKRNFLAQRYRLFPGGEYLFQCGVPGGSQIVQRQCGAVQHNFRGLGDRADQEGLRRQPSIRRKLNDQRAGHRRKQRERVAHGFLQPDTQAVAEGHLGDGGGNAALLDNRSGENGLIFNQGPDFFIPGGQLLPLW